MKEFDSFNSHLSTYENLIAQLSSHGMTIDKELHALIMMSSMPPSWETFVTTISNASTTAMNYASAIRSILIEDARRRSFKKTSSGEAYAVQDTGDRHHCNKSVDNGVVK